MLLGFKTFACNVEGVKGRDIRCEDPVELRAGLRRVIGKICGFFFFRQRVHVNICQAFGSCALFFGVR